jgi:hypothetical protein
MSSISKLLKNSIFSLELDECENVVKIKNIRYLVKELTISHLFTITTDEIVVDFPLPLGKKFSILSYATKPIIGSLDGTEDNRFWLIVSGHKDLLDFGGADGHQISLYRGRKFVIKNPDIFDDILKVKFSLPSVSSAKIKILLKLAILEELK